MTARWLAGSYRFETLAPPAELLNASVWLLARREPYVGGRTSYASDERRLPGDGAMRRSSIIRDTPVHIHPCGYQFHGSFAHGWHPEEPSIQPPCRNMIRYNQVSYLKQPQFTGLTAVGSFVCCLHHYECRKQCNGMLTQRLLSGDSQCFIRPSRALARWFCSVKSKPRYQS